MAFNLVQTVGNGTASSVASLAVTMANTTSGNTMVVAVYVSTAVTNKVQSVTDSQNNVYTRISSQAGFAYDIELWYCNRIIGGTTPTITATITTTNFAMMMFAREYNLFDLANPIDTIFTENQVTVTTAANMFTARQNTLVICISSSNNGSGTGFTGFSNFVQRTDVVRKLNMADKILTNSNVATSIQQTGTADTGNLIAVAFSSPLDSLINNYQFVHAPDGISVSEKIR